MAFSLIFWPKRRIMEEMVNNSIEKGLSAPSAPEKPSNTMQPGKAEALQTILAEVNDIVRESSPTGPGEQWSSNAGGAVTATGGQQTAQTVSWRDQAIANLPAPPVMQQQLSTHIQEEITLLRKQAAKITDLRRPGAAHHFNELQSKIHRLNNLLTALFDASVDVLKRIFIRVFVDKQTIL
jgi:hypothetical protein